MLGLGIGLHKNTFVGGGIDPNQLIINAFKSRVLADGGTFEAEQCLKNSLPALIENEPSLAVTPNAKEVGKLFSIIPTDGSGDLDVVRATTATYVGSDGLIKTALANEVRFDYSNSSCPSILVEPQRTNLALYSEQFDNAAWTTNGLNVTVSSNSTTAPDGTNSADSILTTTTNGLHYVQQRTGSATAGTTYTMSVYVKKLGYDYCRIETSNTATAYAIFRFSTKELTIGGGQVVANSGKVTEMSDGWFRIQMSILPAASVTWRWWVECLNDIGSQSFVGEVTKGLYVWGFQFEVGSYATSYIPTVASTVTRNADAISKTGISSLINSEEGCFFVEANSLINGGVFRQFALSNGTDNSRLTIGWSSIVNTLLIRMDVAGVNVVNNNITSFNQTSNNKILIKWGGGNLKTFINGVERLSLTSLTMPTANLFTKLGFDRGVSATFFEGNVKSVLVFPTQLTDVQCIALTTL